MREWLFDQASPAASFAGIAVVDLPAGMRAAPGLAIAGNHDLYKTGPPAYLAIPDFPAPVITGDRFYFPSHLNQLN
jgi:hypothetical protein